MHADRLQALELARTNVADVILTDTPTICSWISTAAR